MQLKNFIEDNNIELIEGQRNYYITVLCGYAQYIEESKEKLMEIYKDHDNEILEEIERVWNYTFNNNYREWWERAEAKEIWKF